LKLEDLGGLEEDELIEHRLKVVEEAYKE